MAESRLPTLIPRALASRVVILGCAVVAVPAMAHRSPCHLWPNCPADLGEYTCGDMGQCDQCPDDRYCDGRKRRAADGGPLAPVQERLDACTTLAREKNVREAERTAFMLDCMNREAR